MGVHAVTIEHLPRIYGSFAAFEHEEHDRRARVTARAPEPAMAPEPQAPEARPVPDPEVEPDPRPRIYTSFAEFERAECARSGFVTEPAPQITCIASSSSAPHEIVPRVIAPPQVAAVPAIVKQAIVDPRAVTQEPVASTAEHAIVPVASTSPIKRRSMVAHAQITPASLRAEGVLEVGRAPGTSILYVRTRVKLHILHATWVPDRQLDDYAVALAMRWIEDYGMPSHEVASNLGVNKETLRHALLAAGHVALLERDPAKSHALPRNGNRRRFMHRESAHAAP